jgi:PAS domain S-box-containing protein
VAAQTSPALRIAAVAAVTWIASYAVATYLVRDSGPTRDVLAHGVYEIPIALAVGLAWLASRGAEGSVRLMWALLSIALAWNVLGDVLYNLVYPAFGRPDPFPSLADAAYVSSYLLVVPALWIGFGRGRGHLARRLLDASILTGIVSFAGYLLLLRPALEGASSPLEGAIAAAYPSFDLLILLLVLELCLGSSRRPPTPLVLVGAAYGFSCIADFAYSSSSILQQFGGGGWIDIGWQAWSVLLCIAAVSTITRTPHSEPAAHGARERERDGGLRVVLGGAFFALTLFATDLLDASGPDTAVSIVAMLTVVTVSIRLLVTTSEKRDASLSLEVSVRERRRVENLFQQGFTSSQIGMAIVNARSGIYENVNPATAAILGRSVEELVGMQFLDVTAPEDVDASRSTWQAMRTGEAKAYDGQKRYVRGDGTLVWADIHVSPILDGDTELTALFVQIIDATDRKGREAALRVRAEEAEWVAKIRDALASDRLVLHAQPIVDVESGNVVAHELLVRMVETDGSLIAPGRFLPIAERHGIVGEIDEWVVREAIRAAATGMTVTVNVSARSVADLALVRVIEDELDRTGAAPERLVFEITETALMEHLDAARRVVEHINDLGCRVALDDFGTGFSDLTQLKELPADFLKIDMEFVKDLPDDPRSARVVEAITSLARGFGMTTIGEGVENDRTLVALRELGVDCAQGFHLGRPAPLESALNSQLSPVA